MMLKIFRGLVLGLVVLVGSAYVTPTYASSTSVIITQVRAADSLSALNETVNLYNPTPEPVDITGWCLVNKGGKMFACFEGLATGEHIYIQPYSHAVAVSESESKHLDPWHYSVVYSPTHAGNGSIVHSSDYIALIDASRVVVDSFSWSDPVYAGNFFWQRSAVIDGDEIDHYNIDPPADGAPLWYQTMAPFIQGGSQSPIYRPIPMVVFALPVDDGGDSDSGSDSGDSPDEPTDNGNDEINYDVVDNPEFTDGNVGLRLSELLANPVGADKNNEYIELWNPSDVELSTSGYSLQIAGGKSTKIYKLPEIIIGPGEYFAVWNTEISFSLNNTEGVVRLIHGDAIDEVTYQKPKDGLAWALVDSVWVYTSNPTPGEANLGSASSSLSESPDKKDSSVVTSLKPCATNQYRHPETNRCRLIASSTTKSPAPCKEGQERNPETNRCRNIKTVTKLDHGVLGVESAPSGGISPLVIAGFIGLGLIGYGLYEWRSEIMVAVRKTRTWFARGGK